MKIKAKAFLLFCAILMTGMTLPTILAAHTINYGDISLSSNGTTQSGHFSDLWDLTLGDIVITFTYDANGLVDDFGGGAHAWAQLGIRAYSYEGCNGGVGYGDFNPTWAVEGAGVWLATDYDWAVNTFNPDVVPNLDLDDKLILQKAGGNGEGDYNLPSVPLVPGDNHRIWWDRDGVDPWQNPETANTGGIYQIVMTFHATSATTGEAYMTIRGLAQGFETDGNWNTIELTPAGMTFTFPAGTFMQVFYGLYGYGATHSMAFNDIIVTGSPPAVGGEWVPINTVQVLVQIVGSAAVMSAIVASFVGFKRIKKR